MLYITLNVIHLNLLTVGQITVGIRKVWLEFECSPVGGDGFWDVARVFMDGGQVTVGICECWVDLDGSGVAL